jgi:TonB family protein
MHSRSNSPGRKTRLKVSTRSLLLACALGFLTMPYASFGAPVRTAGPQGPVQRAPMVASLMVCDPPKYQHCHRVDGATPARVIHSVTPVYPLAARRARLEGVSVVSLIVDDKGTPQNVSTIRSIADSVSAEHRDAAMEMDRSALASVRKFRFTPAMLNGKPVAIQIKLDMTFHHTAEK